MSSLHSTSPFSYWPFLCSPLEQSSLKDLTVLSSNYLSPHSNQTFANTSTTIITTTPTLKLLFQGHSSPCCWVQWSKLSPPPTWCISNIWYSWSHSTSWKRFLYLTCRVTHWLPPLPAYHLLQARHLVLGPLLFLCTVSWDLMALNTMCWYLPDYTSTLDLSPEILAHHPTIYSAIPFEMLFRQTASQNEWAHNWTPDLPQI